MEQKAALTLLSVTRMEGLGKSGKAVNGKEV